MQFSLTFFAPYMSNKGRNLLVKIHHKGRNNDRQIKGNVPFINRQLICPKSHKNAIWEFPESQWLIIDGVTPKATPDETPLQFSSNKLLKLYKKYFYNLITYD